MSIHLPPIAAAEPPAVPTMPVTGGNGSSFGQFLDKAGTHPEPAAASPSSQPASGAAISAAASSTTSQAAETAHGAASDGGKDGTPPVPAVQSQPIQAAKSVASAVLAHASGIVRDKGGMPSGDQGDSGKNTQSAATPAVSGLIVPASIMPVIAATPPASPIVTTASAAKTIAEHAQAPPTMLANAAVASKGAPAGPAEGDPWIAQPANPANPQPAAMAASFSNLVGGARGAPSDAILRTATQVPASLTPSAYAAPATIGSTEDLHLSAPSGAITIAPPMPAVSSSAPPPVSKSSNKAFGETVSAQAAALLGRVSVLGAGQSRPQAASAPVSGGAPATAISATLTPGSTAPSGQPKGTVPAAPATTGTAATSGTPVTSSTPTTVVTPATTATPLPPISGSVDLTPKFSAAAIPAHADVTSIGGPKAKSDSHPTASVTDPAAGKPPAPTGTTQAETVTVTASAKAAADATLATSTSSKALTATDDDAADAHAANPPTVMPQPRVDATGTASGVPTSQSASETQANPIAALHSVTEQVAIAVKRGVKAGNDQIQINLEPASLGKISVRLDFAQDGRVSAVFSAERADTLNLLNGDARSLEQSLRDAGLRADSGSLTFNLSSGDTGSNARHFTQASGYAAAATAMIESDPLAAPAGAHPVAGGLGHDGSLDIHV